MSDDKQKYFESIEWEFLQNELNLDHRWFEENQFPQAFERFVCYRDDHYKIKGELIGSFDINILRSSFDSNYLLNFPSTITAENTKIKYEFLGCYTYNQTTSRGNSDLLDSDTKYHVNFNIHKIKRNIKSSQKPISWLTEWYLNGSHDSSLFSRTTSRSSTLTVERNRDIYKDNEQKFLAFNNYIGNLDNIFVKYSNYSFIVHTVPKELGPSWSNCIGIEYREEFGEIPVYSDRVAISEIVGFLMGKFLLNIGYSSYDDEGHQLDCMAQSPWWDNAAALSRTSAVPPVNYQKNNPTYEELLTHCVSKYLDVRDKLSLNEALLRYWLSVTMPLGTNIPIFANGIEIISNAWIKNDKSGSIITYLPKDNYDEITEDILKITDEKLNFFGCEEEAKEIIIKRIKDANRKSPSEKINSLFTDLKLNISPLEKKALRERNKMIHNFISFDKDGEIDKALSYYFAYRILFHRVIFRILEYDGDYIEYTPSGPLEKHMNEGVVERLQDS